MKLAQYLYLKRLSQKEFAKQIKVSPSTMCYYLNGARYPSAKAIQRIIDITKGKVTANDFFEVKKKFTPPVDLIAENSQLGQI